MKRCFSFVLILILVFAAAGCNKKPEEPPSASPGPTAAPTASAEAPTETPAAEPTELPILSLMTEEECAEKLRELGADVPEDLSFDIRNMVAGFETDINMPYPGDVYFDDMFSLFEQIRAAVKAYYGEDSLPLWTAAPTEAPTPAPTAMPERPDENTNIPKVIAGEDVFFIVKPDGSLYGWGKNDYGQLGIGTTEDVSAPRFIANGLTPVIVGETVFALSEDNILWGWGRNDMGQLGLGDGENHSRPVELMHFVKEIIPAWGSCYALTESGALYCWGLSGDPNTVDGELEPILVDENVEYFSPYSMIKSGGELWIKRGDWAKIADDIAAVYDEFGEYALGTDGMLYHVSYQNGLEPICDDIRDVKVSDRSAYILKNDGTLWLWNTEGEYHDVPEAELNTLTFIMDGVVEIRCDWEMDEDWGYNYNFALKANGELWAWSMPYSNAVVGKPRENSSTKPACVAENVKYVFTNNAQTYIITEDDEVMATGLADDRDAVHGGLGDGTLETRFGFVSLGLKGICGIYTHLGEVYGEDEDSDWVELYARTFAVDEEGSIWAWGWNGDRLLGTGSSEETVLSPELITINE